MNGQKRGEKHFQRALLPHRFKLLINILEIIMEFDYTINTNKSFDETVEAVQKGIAKADMRVLYVHDVQATLAEKGFGRDIQLRLLNFAAQNTRMIF